LPSARPQVRSQSPRRRAATRRRPVRRRRLGWRPTAILVSLGVVFVIVAWAGLSLAFAPTGNTAATRFDALIVLGSPADSDGNPKPVMLSRVTEAVREYGRGVAPRMIFTGGKDGRAYPEAVVMARVAQAQGVPQSAILVESDSNDTIHNACNTARIMKTHGWRSAEVITSPIHTRRAGIVFSHSPFFSHPPVDWRMHAAPPIEPQSATDLNTSRALEVLKAVRYRLYGSWAESCSP
jgi:uncharacterized SAM-binding protein YcdF (DUF218 family)